jgi:hypothetical protein
MGKILPGGRAVKKNIGVPLRGDFMCLETPKGPDLTEDRENMTLLRSLIES